MGFYHSGASQVLGAPPLGGLGKLRSMGGQPVLSGQLLGKYVPESKACQGGSPHRLLHFSFLFFSSVFGKNLDPLNSLELGSDMICVVLTGQKSEHIYKEGWGGEPSISPRLYK